MMIMRSSVKSRSIIGNRWFIIDGIRWSAMHKRPTIEVNVEVKSLSRVDANSGSFLLSIKSNKV